METTGAAKSFLFLSDVHFDPFADPTIVKSLAATDVSGWKDIFLSSKQTGPSPYGTDANFALLESALDSMASTAKGVDLIIFPGDVLAHKFEEKYATITGDTSASGVASFVQKTVTFFANEVDSRFPKATVLMAIGNNDSLNGDYKSSPGDAYLKVTADSMAKVFFNTDAERAAFLKGYSSAGYYAIEPDGKNGIKYIVLNDIFWSDRSDQTAAGVTELSWLTSQLEESSQANQKVWIVNHIPLGADAKSMAASINKDGLAYKGLMTNGFNDAFAAIETAYAQTIEADLAGHTHRDEFRILSPEPASPYSNLTSISLSISPIDSNNPGYEIYTYDPKSGSLLDKTTYVRDLSKPGTSFVKEYDFSLTYGHGLSTAQDWWATAGDILTQPASQAAYARYYTAGATSADAVPITPANLPVYWLAATNVTPESYALSAAELLSQPGVRSASAFNLLAPTSVTSASSGSNATAAAVLATI
jgi:hypothetical protein